MKIALFIATLAISAASTALSVAAADTPGKQAGGVLAAANGMTHHTFDARKADNFKDVWRVIE